MYAITCSQNRHLHTSSVIFVKNDEFGISECVCFESIIILKWSATTKLLGCVRLSSTRIGRLGGFKLRRSFMLHLKW